MNETREKVKCKRCDEGKVWLTREQVETGTTTKKGEWVRCPCCKGNHRDCMQCYIDEVFGEDE